MFACGFGLTGELIIVIHKQINILINVITRVDLGRITKHTDDRKVVN